MSNSKNTLYEFLTGVAVSAFAYLIIWFITFGKLRFTYSALIDLLIVAAAIFLTVKLHRTGHRTAATTIIVLISPAILALLIMGSCGIMILPH